jgi:hypothetical protein
MSCDGCYCKENMRNKDGCLYLYQSAHIISKIISQCPCSECLIKSICQSRYACENFEKFIYDIYANSNWITPMVKPKRFFSRK